MVQRAVRFARKYAFAAASALYLFTFGVRSSRHRRLLTSISEHFGYSEHRRVPLLLPTIDLGALVPRRVSIELREPLAADGNVTLYELVAIATLVRWSQPQTILEIGTFDGRTTLNLAANSPDHARVYTLDLPREGMEKARLPLDPDDLKYVDKDTSGSRFRGSDCEAKITQLHGDSATFDFQASIQAADFIFIDGSHAYEYVLSDSRRAVSLLRNGHGTLLWHDYGEWPGVSKALNELAASDQAFAGLRRIRDTSLAYLRIDGTG